MRLPHGRTCPPSRHAVPAPRSSPILKPAITPQIVESGEGEALRNLRATLEASIASKLTSGSELVRAVARQRREEILPTTIPPLDALLGGGLARGKMTEIAGRGTRFSIVIATLAAATSIGEAAALIDASDSFDPQLAEAAGVDLRRLLWVRPQTMKETVTAAEMIGATGFQLVIIDMGVAPSARPPRSRRRVGAPGARGGIARRHDPRLRSLRPDRHDLGGDDPRARAAPALARPRQRAARPGRHRDAPETGEASPPAAGTDRRRCSFNVKRLIGGRQSGVGSRIVAIVSDSRHPTADCHGQSIMTRLACFYVPMFVLAARLRSEPDLLNEAVGIVEGNGSNAHIVAATRRARKKGIQPGLSLAQARSLLPKLIARGRDAECERTAQEALLEVAETFSPRVEDAGEGVVFLDVDGDGAAFR